ncbi:MAG: hypothetical protein ACPG6R_10955 [Aequoribacter sp.]|uniref:hypothetical protein n=1 Tax=Aequoribacter sp. TaxID=2847771 RepID=UPI003C40FA27
MNQDQAPLKREIKRKAAKEHKQRAGTHRVRMRSVVSGSVFCFDDDGYAKGNPSLGGPGRSALENAASKRDEDGPIFFPVDKLTPWMKPNAGLMQPPENLLDRVWTEFEDRRLASYQDDHRERMVASEENAAMQKEQHNVPGDGKKGRRK